ncbi:MAG: porin family protein [Tannerella sp.]|jgi:hypothetical protein|nr:porin family protein [Tannerella sp.]
MKRIVFLLLFSVLVVNSYAQTSFDMSKVTVGGAFGMQFGNYTMITIAPQVGYNFTDFLNAGVGISYSFYKDDYSSGTDRIVEKSNYAGLNIYGRLYVLDYLAIQAQPEINYMTNKIEYKNSNLPDVKTEKAVPSFVVGAGFRMGPAFAMLKYDLVQDSYSPYGKRIFYSVGFSF